MMEQKLNSPNNLNSLLENVENAVVVGLGDSGCSCIEYLDEKNIKLIAMDSRQAPPGIDDLAQKYSDVTLIKGKFDVKALLETDLIVLSPGVSLKTAEIAAASDAGVAVVGDIELFAFESSQPIIAITGSNGKSTVTALCAEMLQAAGIDAQVGGNIGRPALDLLTQPASMYVLELSSFQLETTWNLKSSAAVILNISPDHMDRYESIDAYCAAKQRIFKNARNAVYNRDDARSYPALPCLEKIISFGSDEPQNSDDFGIRVVDGRQWLCRGERNLIAAEQLPLKGQHNQLNALAALALLQLVGVDFDMALDGLMQFKGLPHRFEFVGEWGGAEWINDSKGTNPGATLASISGQDKAIILIVGGDAKGAEFSVLTDAIRTQVKAVVLFGRDSHSIEKILPANTPRMTATSLSQVVQIAAELSTKNDMVLFSPACASFDMFENYQQRGDAFKNTVQEYFG